MTDAVKEVRDAIKQKNAIIGAERTIKFLRQGKLRKVFLSKNVKKEIKQDITHYSSINKVPVVELDLSNEDFGTLCKKPFSISVISVQTQ